MNDEILERIASALETIAENFTNTDTKESTTDPNERDVNGHLWDKRLHASTRTKKQNGEWKLRKGVNEIKAEKYLAEIEEEAKAYRAKQNEVVDHIQKEQERAQEFLTAMTPPAPVVAPPAPVVAPPAPVVAPPAPVVAPPAPVVAPKTEIKSLNDLIAKVSEPSSGLSFEKMMTTVKACGYENLAVLQTDPQALKNIIIALGL